MRKIKTHQIPQPLQPFDSLNKIILQVQMSQPFNLVESFDSCDSVVIQVQNFQPREWYQGLCKDSLEAFVLEV